MSTAGLVSRLATRCRTPRDPVAAIGISNDGALLVETDHGIVAVNSGEVRSHDPATLPEDRRGT